MFGILALALLMVVHEGGHFLAARAFGMRVLKFSIGFGPTFFKISPKDGYYWFTSAAEKVKLRLWKHDAEQQGPTVYQVAMIPFLAYVQIAGMNPLEENDPNDKGNFSNGSLWGRIVTIFSGPLANYLFASVFFFGATLYGGKAAEVVINNERQLLTYVDALPGRPAHAAGVQRGDKIVEVAGTPVATWNEMAEQISKRPGEPIKVVVERKIDENHEERKSLDLTPSNEDGKGKIGVAPHKLPVPIKEAAIFALTEPPKVVKSIGAGLSQLFRGNTEDLGGPLRMIKETEAAAKQGLAAYLWLLGVLSAYIGIFNLLPFPALDGGRLVFLAYEAVTRRKPNAMVEVYTNGFGILTLLGLALYITVFKDVPDMLSK